jgi:ketosteroid isomerase-like protein
MLAIRKNWSDMLALPDLSIGWQVTKVDVSPAGEMAYAHGTYEMGYTDPKGKPVKDHGKWVDVFKKGTDGKWKAVVDIINSDVPAAQ